MKITTILLWAINALFAGYLVSILITSQAMQSSDYQFFDRGIALIENLQKISNSANRRMMRIAEDIVEKEGNRSMDVIFLKKMEQIIVWADSANTQLENLDKSDYKALVLLDLARKYNKKLANIDTAIVKSIDTVFSNPVWYATTENPNFKKLQIINNQIIIKNNRDIAFNSLMKKIGYGSCGFLGWRVISITKSNLVDLGKEYESILVLGWEKTSNLSITNVRFNGKNIPEENYYTGKFEVVFPVTAITFDPNGECRKTWKAEITIAKPLKDTTYVIEKEYIIKRKQ